MRTFGPKLSFNLYLIITLFASCTSNLPKSIADLEQEILQRPLVGAVDFFQKNDSTIEGFRYQEDSYQYFLRKEFNDSISNGFFGPVTDEFVFDQIISFDIESPEEWQIINQTAFPGRLVQNSRKGAFSVFQTLFFVDSVISVNIYTIKNTDSKKRLLKPHFTYYLNSQLKLEKRKGYGARFLTGNGEYWPHSSGEDKVYANIDSTIFSKKNHPIELLPQEEIELYSVLYLKEGIDSIRKSPRPKPWMCFPIEELAKNTMRWGYKLSE